MTKQRFNFTILHRTTACPEGTPKKFHALATREEAEGAFMRAYGYFPADEDFVWVERYRSIFSK